MPSDIRPPSTCFTCKPLQQYVDLTDGFANKLSSTLHAPMLILFGSIVMLWVIIAAYRLLSDKSSYGQIIKDLIFIIIASVLLGSQGDRVIYYVYKTSLAVLSGSANTAFSVAGDLEDNGYSGIVNLAATAEAAMAKVIQAASAIASAGDWYHLQNYVYAIVLIVPFFLLIAAYSSQVVIAIFRIMMMAVFAPFTFAVLGYPWGRSVAFSGARTILGAIAVLFASTVALGLVIYGINHVILDPTKLHGDALNKFASISNPDFLVILFLGWLGTTFMTEGTSLANSVVQTAFTNTAAGIMTAGAVGTVAAVGKAGLSAASFAAGGVAGKALAGQSAMMARSAGAAKVLDRIQNVNKPGGTGERAAG